MYLIDDPPMFGTVGDLMEYLVSLERLPDEPEVVLAREMALWLLRDTVERERSERSKPDGTRSDKT